MVRGKRFVRIVLIVISVILFNMLLCYVSRLHPLMKDPPHRMVRFSPFCEQKKQESGDIMKDSEDNSQKTALE